MPLSRATLVRMDTGDEARFTDLFRPSMPRVSRTVRRERLDICQKCDHYSKRLSTCGICGCVMPLKVTLAHAECPIKLWGQITDETAPPPSSNLEE